MKIQITTDEENICEEENVDLLIYGYVREAYKREGVFSSYDSVLNFGWDELSIASNATALQIAANLFFNGIEMINERLDDLHPGKEKLDQAIALLKEVIVTENYISTENGIIQ